MENKKLKLWTWRFIRENRKLPGIHDFSGDFSPTRINEIILSSGPSKYTFGYIQSAFKRFFNENGHYPTAPEIDKTNYFPRARSLERSWGGVINLRKLFGLEILDYSLGKARSDTADKVNKTALEYERKMEVCLVEIYGEEFVHVERRWSSENKNRLDFYVYAKNGQFGIDVFNPSTIFNLKVEILSKARQYRGAPFPLFLVYANPLLDSGEVNRAMSNKKTPLPPNFKTIAWNTFFDQIQLKFAPREVHEKFHGK